MRQFSRLLITVIGLAALAPVASDAAKDFRQPNTYAVVIGISQYREEVIPKIAYGSNDAQAIARLLEAQGGIPKTNIKLLTDSKATLADFRNHFGSWLRMRVKPDSTVYVYFAGHGTPNPQTGEAYLVPWEGHPDFPDGLYPLKELYETLNKLPAKDVVVLLDSCFSGAAGRSVLAKGGRPMVVSVENPLLAAGKVIVLAASSGSQISSDYEKAGHGLFTHYLLTGLQGEADADRDGIVTLREVVPYVQERVAKTAVDELNREQTPTLLPGEEVLRSRVALPLTLASPDRAALMQAEQELKALEAQERQVEEQNKLAAVQKQIEEKKKQIERKKQDVIEEARVRPYEAPSQAGGEFTGKAVSAMALYNQSYNDYLKGNYDLAISGFGEFLKNFPGVTQSAHAQYWIGRSYFSQKDYRPAIETYERVIAEYPKSDKVPAALFEVGLAHAELGDAAKARERLKQVIDKYPQSIEASRARQKLADLPVPSKQAEPSTPRTSDEINKLLGQLPPASPTPIEEAHVRPPSAPEQIGRETTSKDGAPMVLVPEGEFLYGDDKRRVTLKAFYMDKYEVTTSRYAKFRQDTGTTEAPKYWERATPVSFGDRPVVGVEWVDASTYCKWAGKRLPTEQEWEKAARGTDGRMYPWGEDAPTRLHANFGKSEWKGYATLVPVGKLEDGKSPYGIYNMAGNVWEWTSSDYDSSTKVLRGGSWDADARSVRSANRGNDLPTRRDGYVGFRCAKDAR